MLPSETRIVKHRFTEHGLSPNTETLIIGTFNPEAPSNKAEFFYSTGRNYLWRILPSAFGGESLQGKSAAEKRGFIRAKRIDFIDLIEVVQVDKGCEGVRSDAYIDSKVISWADVVGALDNLPMLRRACFTRKTFRDIPEIRSRIEVVSQKLRERAIGLKLMVSPARYYDIGKQKEWTEFLTS